VKSYALRPEEVFGNGDEAPHICNIGTTWWSVVSLTFLLLCLRVRSSLDRRLGFRASPDAVAKKKKSLSLPIIEPWSSSPMSALY
jgi:hypothetical protein